MAFVFICGTFADKMAIGEIRSYGFHGHGKGEHRKSSGMMAAVRLSLHFGAAFFFTRP